MSRREILLPSYKNPAGTVTTTVITIWLVDENHKQIIGYADNYGIISTAILTIAEILDETAEPVQLTLTPQSEIIPADSYYAIRIDCDAQNQVYYVQVPDGDEPIALQTLLYPIE